jgi:uncharacterized protein YhaN
VQSQVLSGWKDIANYLGKGVRTVQRYERELNLPVRRPSRKSKGSVITTRSELDAWVAGCQLSHRPQHADTTSVLVACSSLKQRLAEMDQLATRMKKLRSEVRTSSEMLRETIRRIHEGTNRKDAEFRRLNVVQFPGRRVG